MQEAQEVEKKEMALYRKLMDVFAEMMDLDNSYEEMKPFSLLFKGIAIEISEYEDNKGWMKRKKK